MSVTYGFYNSLNHDRKYNTIQISKMFDGIIKDGIFMSIGNHFTVSAGTGMVVNVDTGKAWFNHTWTENDSILPVDVDQSEVVLNRIDSLILEVNSSTRINEIKFLKGTPSSTPVAPALTNNDMLHQYLLCTVTIPAGVTAITGSMIQSYIGMGDTPFVSGVLETVDLNTLLGQWQASLTEFISNETSEFITWFDAMKGQLTTDAAGNLQTQIDSLTVNVADKLSSTSDTKDNVTTFTSASVVENILTGEKHSTIFGKIRALFDYFINHTTERAITLPCNGWTAESGGYWKAVPLAGVKHNARPLWTLATAGQFPTATENAVWKLLTAVSCTTNTLTFHATGIPTADVTICLRLM